VPIASDRLDHFGKLRRLKFLPDLSLRRVGMLRMIFFWAETPDGWGIPGIHGPFAEDELGGYVQSGVDLIRGQDENLLIDSGNWTLPEYDNGMGDFLVGKPDCEKNDLKYLFLSYFHYDHVGNALMQKERYGAIVVCHSLDPPIIEDPMLVTRRENVARLGITPEAMLEDFNIQPGESFGLSDPAAPTKESGAMRKRRTAGRTLSFRLSTDEIRRVAARLPETFKED
jgi:glyoxylase-like metal-dependent hydrolase (beta-lactamase superfamily II)